MNRAAKIQTGLNFAETIDDLAAYHPELPTRLRALHPGELSILQVRRGEEHSQLILSSMSFIVLDKALTVISLKNIRSVLENKETEAWQKLIRVLTHEIMNSMTPIVSLAELLKNNYNPTTSPSEDREEISEAFETVFRQSKGLVRFVENYRKVTGIPTPISEIIGVEELLAGVCLLFQDKADGLKHCPAAPGLKVIADKALIEQVLINLIKKCARRNRRLRTSADRTIRRSQCGRQNLHPGKRQRHRHPGGSAGAHLHPILHHQTFRLGHRAKHFTPDHAHAQGQPGSRFGSRKRKPVPVSF